MTTMSSSSDFTIGFLLKIQILSHFLTHFEEHNIDWRYVPQSMLKNATDYHRIFNKKPIVKSDENDIVVIETSLKRL